MKLTEAVQIACKEPTLGEALNYICIWESKRLVEYVRNNAGPWETCFGICISTVMAEYKNKSKVDKMRLYCFGNMYLSSIQQGIQAGHVIGNMSVKYNKDSMYQEWANDYKTIILLNGGMSVNLATVVQHFSDQANPFDWDYFNESKDALDGALTSVGIILPEEVFMNAKLSKLLTPIELIERSEREISRWEQDLYKIISSAKVAS